MSKNCDITLQWSGTPAQLTALGAALWRECTRAAGATGIYQHLDNRTRAALLAGRLPEPSHAAWPPGRQGVRFWVRDEASHDRQATIGSLRREIPAEGVEDIVVDANKGGPADYVAKNGEQLVAVARRLAELAAGQQWR